IFDPFIGLEAAMGQQSVIANAYTRTPGQPKKKEAQQHGLPVEEKWRGQRAHVKCSHKKSGERADWFRARAIVRQKAQVVPSFNVLWITNYQERWRHECNSCVIPEQLAICN